MKIISIRWKHGSSDFVHVIANDDVADTHYRQLKRADTQGLFDIAVCASDAFVDALAYIQTETDSHTKELANDGK